MRDFTLIFGCMFSGKTTRLIELYNYSDAEEQGKLAIKPLLDNRYQASKINAHSGLQMPGHRISKPEEIYPLLHPDIKEVYLDEVQFFSESICNIIGDLNFQGIKVMAAGLNKDFNGNDFGPFPQLLKMATEKIELKARCEICGAAASHTFRNIESDDLILVAGKDAYQARCTEHWEEGMKMRKR